MLEKRRLLMDVWDSHCRAKLTGNVVHISATL
jgi:hypothetical protein